MTPDARITHDLAILGRVNRERPLTLEATLQLVGAAPVARTAVRSGDVSMVPLARIFVQRVARTWAGAAALATTLLLFVFVVVPRDPNDPAQGVAAEVFYVHLVWLFTISMIPALVAYCATTVGAMRRFDRALRTASDPRARARQMIDRAARASIVMPMLGIGITALFFGLVYVTVGGWSIDSMRARADDPHMALICGWTLRATAVAGLAFTAATFVLSRRRAPLRRSIVLGALIGLATMVVGMRYDIGPLHATMMFHEIPSFSLRSILTATGTLGLILFVGGGVLARMEQEDRELSAHLDE